MRALLAERLSLARSRVEIVRGHTARTKVVRVLGLAPEDLSARLAMPGARVAGPARPRAPPSGRARRSRSSPSAGRGTGWSSWTSAACPGRRCTSSAARGPRWRTRSGPWRSAAPRRSAWRRRSASRSAGLASPARDGRALLADLETAIAGLATTRPTAVNLFWAIDRMRRYARGHATLPPAGLRAGLVREAEAIFEEDVAANRRLGAHGAALLSDGARILTHCNAGALATAGYGTALGIDRAAPSRRGSASVVCVDETRPVLQGARLTAWELAREGIPHAVIADVTAASPWQRGEVDLRGRGRRPDRAERRRREQDRDVRAWRCWRGATASRSTWPRPSRPSISRSPTAPRFPIEERDPREVQELAGRRIAPAASPARNPAFDVTPAALITAIVTERGIHRPPYHFQG